MTGRYRVSDRTQLNHDGRLYGPGDEVNLEPDEARRLVAAGTVEKVTDKKR